MTMNIALSALYPDPAQARRSPPAPADVTAMAASMAHVGQLQNIVVRMRGDGSESEDPTWFVVIGNTRVAAARELGWAEITAEVLAEHTAEGAVLAISAAENMVRRDMHPVDTWRALAHLTANGLDAADAARILGLDERGARRLAHLGAMAPALIDAIAAEPLLPREHDLRAIASAPHHVQEAALAEARKYAKGGAMSGWWHTVGQRCTVTRIPATRAIFTVGPENGVVFDEDLFAEPGSDEQFTTTDVAGFLAAQDKALLAKAAESNGRALVSEYNINRRDIVAPDGYMVVWDTVPKRWKKSDPRKVLWAVIREGYEIGVVREYLAVPKPKRGEGAAHGAAHTAGAPSGNARPRDPITKAVQARLASLKYEAVTAALPGFAARAKWPDLLRAVLLAFGARNVSVQTSAQLYGRASITHTVTGLVDAAGKPAADSDALREAAAAVLARVLMFDHPNSFASSGPAAEWIGAMVGAAKTMPRCDTEEILRGFSGDKLAEIAEAHGIDASGKVSVLRKRLVGNLPNWVPVEFAAARPEVEPDDADDDTEPMDGEFDEVEPAPAKRGRKQREDAQPQEAV